MPVRGFRRPRREKGRGVYGGPVGRSIRGGRDARGAAGGAYFAGEPTGRPASTGAVIAECSLVGCPSFLIGRASQPSAPSITKKPITYATATGQPSFR